MNSVLARIQQTVDRTSTGHARIKVKVTKSLTGQSRIVQTVDHTLDGKSRIKNSHPNSDGCGENLCSGNHPANANRQGVDYCAGTQTDTRISVVPADARTSFVPA